MLVQAKYSSKASSVNQIYLVSSKSKIKNFIEDKAVAAHFESKWKEGTITTLDSISGKTILVKIEKLDQPKNKEAVRKAGATIFKQIQSSCKDVIINAENDLAIELFCEGFSLASYSFTKYFTDKSKQKQTLKDVYVASKSADLKRINSIVDATVWSRDLVNEPVSYLTAEKLAEEILKKAENTGLKVEVLTKQKIKSLKMGGLLAVNKGSIDPPTFTIIEWKNKKAVNKKPIVLVGKGVVYDTGGLSLKPTANSMDMMKCDMGGAAAMAGTMMGIAALNLPLHVIALIPATDNRPGGNAYAPGDVITMFNGTTVEVLNTDAEGRMILADALAYSNKYNPELVIDAATLTGAAVRAIGTFASCVMGNAPQKEIDLMIESGMDTYDRVVQLPFWDDYFEEMKSKIADLKNLGGPYAGMITAGKFLEHFTDSPYIHIDIAGPAYLTSEDSYRGTGGTGAGVRLLIDFLTKKANGGK